MRWRQLLKEYQDQLGLLRSAIQLHNSAGLGSEIEQRDLQKITGDDSYSILRAEVLSIKRKSQRLASAIKPMDLSASWWYERQLINEAKKLQEISTLSNVAASTFQRYSV